MAAEPADGAGAAAGAARAETMPTAPAERQATLPAGGPAVGEGAAALKPDRMGTQVQLAEHTSRAQFRNMQLQGELLGQVGVINMPLCESMLVTTPSVQTQQGSALSGWRSPSRSPPGSPRASDAELPTGTAGGAAGSRRGSSPRGSPASAAQRAPAARHHVSPPQHRHAPVSGLGGRRVSGEHPRGLGGRRRSVGSAGSAGERDSPPATVAAPFRPPPPAGAGSGRGGYSSPQSPPGGGGAWAS